MSLAYGCGGAYMRKGMLILLLYSYGFGLAAEVFVTLWTCLRGEDGDNSYLVVARHMNLANLCTSSFRPTHGHVIYYNGMFLR